MADAAEDDLDPSPLMWKTRRNLRRYELAEQRVVVHIESTDVPRPRRTWWLPAARGAGWLVLAKYEQ